jgi:hypothetical protein
MDVLSAGISALCFAAMGRAPYRVFASHPLVLATTVSLHLGRMLLALLAPRAWCENPSPLMLDHAASRAGPKPRREPYGDPRSTAAEAHAGRGGLCSRQHLTLFNFLNCLRTTSKCATGSSAAEPLKGLRSEP